MTASRAPLRRRFARATAGVSAVEFALLSPVFMLFLGFLLDVGLAYNAKLRLISGVSAAAHYAYVNGQSVTKSSAAGFLSAVSSVATTTARLTPAPTVSVLFNNAAGAANVNAYFCVSGPAPAALVWRSTGTSPSSCGGSVTSGKFVTITLSTTTPTVFFPVSVVSRVISERDSAIVRVQ